MSSSSTFEHSLGRMERPSFSTHITTDRLRESERKPSSTNSTLKLKPQRRSVFREEGLDDLNTSVYRAFEPTSAAVQNRRSEEDSKYARVTFDEILKDIPKPESVEIKKEGKSAAWLPKMAKGARPMIRTSASAPPGSFPTLSRTALIVFLIALVVPGSQYLGKERVNVVGADATPVRGSFDKRDISNTDVCKRWAHQVANVNGTVYIYGGESMKTPGQTDTWNNDFITLDLTKTWKITSPSLSGLTKPSGPPAVALGTLWNSYDSLWLYGGQFSKEPKTEPVPLSTWRYDIKGASWEEFANPQTHAGNFSDGGGKPVQRAAEGAGISIPEVGRGYYFGGHLDDCTTPGWSNQIPRVYLKSFLEFTFPGYANTGVTSLGSAKAASKEGVYRNITEGGIQNDNAFEQRADSSLVYIPGWGTEGIILGLGGGTNATFSSMSIIDVYDVANSIWYKQATTGESPLMRVNPCTIVAAAADGSSFNIYMYGGQNLIPFGSQIQYTDMWILSIPSFTWIKVNLDGQSQPPARAGHSCVLWDAQMVTIGGYVGQDLSCDAPGIYVFDPSTLKWKNDFTPLSTSDSKSSASSGSSSSSGSQLSSGSDSPEVDQYQGSSIFRSSHGYQVPEAVISIIGGSAQGGATATTPASGPATAGPIATGKPPTFTVTASGSVVTQTSPPNASDSQPQKQRSNVGVIAAGAIAGILAVLAAYLAFCSWLYRRQLKQYKNHVAMAQRTGFVASPEPPGSWSGSNDGRSAGGVSTEKPVGAAGVMLGPFGTQITNSTSRSSHSRTQSGASRPSGEAESAGGVYGGGAMPGGRLYADEDRPNYGRPSGSTAHSSTEDLLGGLEPSFFNVVLNPRRTLRVVNSDSD